MNFVREQDLSTITLADGRELIIFFFNSDESK